MSDKKNHFITSLTYPLKASSPRKIAVIGGGIAGMEVLLLLRKAAMRLNCLKGEALLGVR